MNELQIIAVGNVTNGRLKTQLNNINKEMLASNKASWEICKAFHEIVTGELFEQDFKTEKAFAEFVGVSKGQMNKMHRAYSYHKMLTDYDERLSSLTVSKVMELLPIQEDELTSFVKELDIDDTWTTLDIRESVKEWTTAIEADNETEETEEVEEPEETQQPDKNSKPIIDTAKSVLYDGKYYMIPSEKEEELLAWLIGNAVDIIVK